VGIGERDAALYNRDGIDIGQLRGFRDETGSVRSFPGAETLADPDAIWDIECDILIPAAMENQITLATFARIRTKVLAEAANGPTTPGAERVLLDRGVQIIPDLYLNSGGVTVSYFEWGKNLSHMRFGRLQKHLTEIRNQRLLESLEGMMGDRFPEKDKNFLGGGYSELDLVNSGLEETMVSSYRRLREINKTKVPAESMRTAAFVDAIQEVALNYEQSGVFP
jgi:glutamate dehydrogenase (NAD(P)+)